MDIVVKGRHCEVSERFRRHVAEKLAKVERLDSKVIRVDVEVIAEKNPRQADTMERVELTVHSKGPVIRAEAAADDRHGALDLAVDKLEARLRKASERRRDRRRVPLVRPDPVTAADRLAPVNGAVPTPSDVAEPEPPDDAAGEPADTGPFVVREKVHQAAPMTLDQALYEMELVGHDFFLFVDDQSHSPSVVYRRRGYDYGVIRLQL